MSATHKIVTLAQRPKGNIVPGQTFKLETRKSPSESDLKNGQVLFQTLYLSVDPAMRGWLNDTRSYLPPVGIGEVMRGQAIGVVKASKSSKYSVGDYALGFSGCTELAVVGEKDLEKVHIPKGGRVTDAISVLGMTGKC